MNRRDFLAHATTLAAGTALAPRALHAACTALPAGVQLFTLRDALQSDPRGTLAKLHEIGIVEGELWSVDRLVNDKLFGLGTAELKQAFAAAGVKIPSAHIGDDLTNTGAVADVAHALGIGMLIVASGYRRRDRAAISPVELRRELDLLAKRLNQAGREYRSHGIQFGYHNHEDEFAQVEDVVPYDYLMSHTDPDLVKIEFDIGWLAYASRDPVAYLRRYAGRVVACHLKDYDPKAPGVREHKLVPPGEGTIDFAAVLAAMRAAKVAHGFIEIDVSDDPLAGIARGHQHLQHLQGCA
jgi:sugar phosphate isomerase/epimerase